MNANMTNNMLTVPGARLYHEVRGQGPVLALIPGGPTDAGVYAELADALAPHYTVLTYDPRGNSRSEWDGEPEALDVNVQADDLAALIDTLGGEAFVFGNSGGAQIGLNLAVRYPEKVRVLIAHEPPCLNLMNDPSQVLANDQAVMDALEQDGVEAAMHLFMSQNGLEEEFDGEPGDGPPSFEMPPEVLETFARVEGNMEYFFRHGMTPLSRYTPDIATLRAGRPSVIVGLGEQSVGQPIEEMTLALAKALDVKPVMFPGDHGGYGTQPTEFAEVLHRTLGRA